MKGRLKKENQKWYVEEPSGLDFTGMPCLGGLYLIHPKYLKYYFLDDEDSGRDVEFEIVEETYAKLIKYKVEASDYTNPNSMINRLTEHLKLITPEEFIKEMEDINSEGFGEGKTMGEFLKLNELEAKLDKALSEETSESLNKWFDGKNNTCTLPDCPHCAYEEQQIYEEELEREAAIDFAKWLAQSWMSMWVKDRWLWENVEEEKPQEYMGYKTEEELYELYLKSS